MDHLLVIPLLNDHRAKPNPTATPIPCDKCGATCRLSAETAKWLSDNPDVTAVVCLDCAQAVAAESEVVKTQWAGVKYKGNDPTN